MTKLATVDKRTEQISRIFDWRLLRHQLFGFVGWGLFYVGLLCGAVIFSAPLAWMITTSLKPVNQAISVPIQWIPERIVWNNYIEPWSILPLARFYWNSFYIAILNVFGLVLSSSLVAFGFARIRFRGRDILFGLVLATMMLPDQVTLIPIYLAWSAVGLVGTYLPLMIPQWLSTGYNVFLLRQFFMTVNTELDDAARIDGAGWFTIYARILMPMSKAALGVVAIQAFAWNWNNFLDPLIYISETAKFTISIGLRLFQRQDGDNLGHVMAMTLVALIPVLIVFYIAQQRFVRGIVISGVKG